MITLFHGDNLVASRNTLNNFIKKEKSQGIVDIVRLNGEAIELVDLTQAMESRSLFGSNRLIIIENLLSRKPSKIKDALLDYLNTTKTTASIFLWEKKAATATLIKKLPSSTRIQAFKISPKIFAFLDSLAPGNTKQMFLLMHECIKQENPEMVFYMLARRVSHLIIASDSGLEGLNTMHNWQKQRLTAQAKKFTLPQLIKLHENLYNTDKGVKTGRNILPLASMLDLVIAEI